MVDGVKEVDTRQIDDELVCEFIGSNLRKEFVDNRKFSYYGTRTRLSSTGAPYKTYVELFQRPQRFDDLYWTFAQARDFVARVIGALEQATLAEHREGEGRPNQVAFEWRIGPECGIHDERDSLGFPQIKIRFRVIAYPLAAARREIVYLE